MRYLKYSILILIFSITFGNMVFNAERYPRTAYFTGSVLDNDTVIQSNIHNKLDVSVQKYTNTGLTTLLNSNCTSCKVRVKLYDTASNSMITSISTGLGTTYSLGSASANLSTYKLTLEKNSFSLFDLSVFSEWLYDYVYYD